ncbi:hypothetical protein T4A_11520 [Trichinella pseudospiralis]|uniref:Uncharacterized protein n=1 Tax=Trichinella pseudospiralis TaxID=6337 RepID=A0A0V1DMV6_TRIPS|nr:hypothetical protein T4A_11520 [Trichinella pseudospiralis]
MNYGVLENLSPNYAVVLEFLEIHFPMKGRNMLVGFEILFRID